jgi:hypothetical protein
MYGRLDAEERARKSGMISEGFREGVAEMAEKMRKRSVRDGKKTQTPETKKP